MDLKGAQTSRLDRLDPSERHAVGGIWAFRARLEENASARFERLGRRLEHVGAGREALPLARRAVRDERRHAALCDVVAGHYGGAPPRVRLSPDDIAPAHFSLRDRALYEVVAFCCLTESINAVLMSVTLKLATAPPIRAAVRAILRDEVWHARLGWAHLAHERAHGRGDCLGEALPRMLRGTVEEELFDAEGPADAGTPALVAHGELPRPLRLEIFATALRDVVFPGLENSGVPTVAGREWLRRSLEAGGWATRH